MALEVSDMAKVGRSGLEILSSKLHRFPDGMLHDVLPHLKCGLKAYGKGAPLGLRRACHCLPIAYNSAGREGCLGIPYRGRSTGLM